MAKATNTTNTTVAAALEAGRATRRNTVTVNKAAAAAEAKAKADKAAKKAAKKAKKAAKGSKGEARTEAAEAVNGVSLAALRFKAATGAVTGGRCIADYAKGLTDKYGKECAAASRAFKANPTSNLGKAMDEERTAFIGQCVASGASRGNARVYWSRVLNAVDNGRGTRDPKALKDTLKEAATVGAKRALHWQRDNPKKALSVKEGKALGLFEAVLLLFGEDVEALRVQCAKAPTVGVSKK